MSADTHAPRATRWLSLGIVSVIGLSGMTACDAALDEDPTDDDVTTQQQQQGGEQSSGRQQRDAGRQQQDAGRQQQAQPQQPRPPGAAVAQRDASGGFFVGVNARGTGCPAGSWRSEISSDGQTFTMTFSSYEVRVDANTASSSKDCTLGLKLSSPRGLQFSLPNLYYGGYAFLERGVRGRQSASYTFRDTGTQISQPAGNLNGPYDASFLFTHGARTVNDRSWAPCGYDRVVNVSTQLNLQNGTPRGEGYMNLSAVDGEAKLVLKLAWRGCNAPARAPTTGTAGTAAASGARSSDATTAGIAAQGDNESWSTPAVRG